MGITAQIDLPAIREALEKAARECEQEVIAALKGIGDTVVRDIRMSHISDWTDQTGNLRSSIGYVIVKDGVPIEMSSFDRVDGPKRGSAEDTEDGSQKGRDLALSLASQQTNGISLVLVAGMEYASYVEKIDNKVVLAQGELEAANLVYKMLDAINNGKNGR